MMQDDEFESHEEPEESITKSILRFEEMLRNKKSYFFDADTLLRITEFYIENFEFEKALDVVKYAENINPAMEVFQIKEAYITYLMGNNEEALEMLERLQDIYPLNEEIYLIKGAILNNLQQHKAALEVFKHLLTFTEFKEDAYYQMALTYNYMQDLHGAIHYLKNCLFENKK